MITALEQQRFERERNLFLKASDFEDADRRTAYLASEPDATIRARVADLLASEAESEFMAAPLIDQMLAQASVTRSLKARFRRFEWSGPEQPASYPFLTPSPDSADGESSLGRLDKYDVKAERGSGSFGIVFEAKHLTLGNLVAIKVLKREHMEQGADALIKEAKIAASLKHNHIVAVHDALESPVPFIVMELVDGKPLDKWLACQRPDILRIVQIGHQVALGLAHAHERGITHRDLKPANIFLTPKGDVKIGDFGLAQTPNDSDLRVGGTVPYMSPEQARGESIDFRSDQFSLGTILYEMCAAVRPFRGSNRDETLRQLETCRPLAVQTLRADVPDWLAQLIAKLHSRDPHERFQTTDEIAKILSKNLIKMRYESEAKSTVILPSPQAASQPAPTKRSSLRRWITVSFGLACLMLAGAYASTLFSVRTKAGEVTIEVIGTDQVEVKIDDRPLKTTEIQVVRQDGKVLLEFKAAKGDHRLQLTAPGFEVWSRELKVDVDSQSVTARLTPAPQRPDPSAPERRVGAKKLQKGERVVVKVDQAATFDPNKDFQLDQVAARGQRGVILRDEDEGGWILVALDDWQEGDDSVVRMSASHVSRQSDK